MSPKPKLKTLQRKNEKQARYIEELCHQQEVLNERIAEMNTELATLKGKENHYRGSTLR